MELEQELERTPDPRPHDQVKCLYFILFLFVLFEEASKLRSFSGASRLRSLLAATKPCNAPSSRACPAPELATLQQQAPEHESLLRCNSKLQSVRACYCNATNSGACPALELAAAT